MDEKGAMAGEIVTRTRRFYIGDDGIFRTISLPGVEETLADAIENVRAAVALSGGRRYPVLADSRLVKSGGDRAVRAYYAGPELTATIRAVAVLIVSPVQRVIANFFLGLHKPPYPSRVFTSETEALAWLQRFVQPDDKST